VINYTHFNQYLHELSLDVYPQPIDKGHYKWASDGINFLSETIQLTGCTVLDVGCGEAFVYSLFCNKGAKYIGVTLGTADLHTPKDYVFQGDFHFLSFIRSKSFSLVYSRHSLEHSPMPLLALMEWHRVSSKWLYLIVPDPLYWGNHGRNHYSVFDFGQLQFLLERAGWNIKTKQNTKEEFRILCEKVERKIPYYE